MTTIEQIEATRKEIIPLIEKHAALWRNELLPALAKEKIFVWKFTQFGLKRKENLREFFKQSILPLVKTRKEEPMTQQLRIFTLHYMFQALLSKILTT